jgi:antirestriction protein ArdC
MKKEMIEKLTAQLLERLENAMGNWQKPFASPAFKMPYNAVSKKAYRGYNVVVLAFSGYHDPRWIGFKQCQELGGTVRKGEKSTAIIRWIPKNEEEAEDEAKDNKGGFLTYNTVFNVDQTNLVEIGKLPPIEVPPVVVKNTEDVQALVKTLQVQMKESLQGRAYYSPTGDFIHLPKPELFVGEGEYFSTFAHELGHWTGHESRLNREFGKSFGTKAYAYEELVAEIFAMLFSQEVGAVYKRDEETHVVDNNVLYIKHWLKTLKDDPKHVISATTKAYDAFEWVLERLGKVEKVHEKVEKDPEKVEKVPEKVEKPSNSLDLLRTFDEILDALPYPLYSKTHQECLYKWIRVCKKTSKGKYPYATCEYLPTIKQYRFYCGSSTLTLENIADAAEWGHTPDVAENIRIENARKMLKLKPREQILNKTTLGEYIFVQTDKQQIFIQNTVAHREALERLVDPHLVIDVADTPNAEENLKLLHEVEKGLLDIDLEFKTLKFMSRLPEEVPEGEKFELKKEGTLAPLLFSGKSLPKIKKANLVVETPNKTILFKANKQRTFAVITDVFLYQLPLQAS